MWKFRCLVAGVHGISSSRPWFDNSDSVRHSCNVSRNSSDRFGNGCYARSVRLAKNNLNKECTKASDNFGRSYGLAQKRRDRALQSAQKTYVQKHSQAHKNLSALNIFDLLCKSSKNRYESQMKYAQDIHETRMKWCADSSARKLQAIHDYDTKKTKARDDLHEKQKYAREEYLRKSTHINDEFLKMTTKARDDLLDTQGSARQSFTDKHSRLLELDNMTSSFDRSKERIRGVNDMLSQSFPNDHHQDFRNNNQTWCEGNDTFVKFDSARPRRSYAPQNSIPYQSRMPERTYSPEVDHSIFHGDRHTDSFRPDNNQFDRSLENNLRPVASPRVSDSSSSVSSRSFYDGDTVSSESVDPRRTHSLSTHAHVDFHESHLDRFEGRFDKFLSSSRRSKRRSKRSRSRHERSRHEREKDFHEDFYSKDTSNNDELFDEDDNMSPCAKSIVKDFKTFNKGEQEEALKAVQKDVERLRNRKKANNIESQLEDMTEGVMKDLERITTANDIESQLNDYTKNVVEDLEKINMSNNISRQLEDIQQPNDVLNKLKEIEKKNDISGQLEAIDRSNDVLGQLDRIQTVDDVNDALARMSNFSAQQVYEEAMDDISRLTNKNDIRKHLDSMSQESNLSKQLRRVEEKNNATGELQRMAQSNNIFEDVMVNFLPTAMENIDELENIHSPASSQERSARPEDGSSSSSSYSNHSNQLDSYLRDHENQNLRFTETSPTLFDLANDFL